MTNKNKEQGIVSILTVLFLVILLSVLTVAFLRIMSDEQEQAINDDLTKSAYASALSGVEDAKRALAHCNSLTAGATRNQCFAQMTNQNCPGILGSTVLTGGANPIINASGQVGGDPALNQRYTCLIMRLATANYVGQASQNSPKLVELTPDTGSFSTIVVRWHRIGTGAGFDGPAVFSSATPNTNPRDGAWTNGAGQQAVDMLRAQVMAYEPSSGTSVTLDDMNRKTAAAYFVPRASTFVTGQGRVVAPQGGSSQWQFSSGSRQSVGCTTNEATYGGYSCELRIGLFATSSALNPRNLNVSKTASTSSRYFLLLSSMYDDPNFEVTLESSGGNPVDFYAVQPEVDVTGAAGDAYRRILARIEYENGFTPKDALQTGASLCKSFYVTPNAWTPGNPDQPASGDTVCSGLEY